MKARIVVLLAVCILSCKKSRHAGDSCEPLEKGMMGCESASTALYCLDMKLRAIPCRGPKGCSPGACDTTLAREGEPCELSSVAPASKTCGEDRVLTCERTTNPYLGKWVTTRLCRGPKKCSRTPLVICDQTYGEVGDVCADTVFQACSVDRKTVLQCEHGVSSDKFVAQADCVGSKGCVVRQDDVLTVGSCDYSEATVGTACGRGHEHLRVCAPDGSGVLECQPETMKFALSVTCKKGERCRKDATTGFGVCQP